MVSGVAFVVLPVLAVASVVSAKADLSAEFLASPAVTQEMVDSINNDPKSSWRAELSPRFKGLTVGDVVDLCGVRDHGMAVPAPLKVYNDSNSVSVADGLDWREKMGAQCPSIGRISDQANCGSCWAFGSVEVMEARLCIQSKGSVRHQLSEQHLVSCALGGRGCSGGQPLAAWRYFQSDGLVTGGAHGDASGGCYPYALPPCNHHTSYPKYPDCPADKGTPSCNKVCVDGASWERAIVRNAHAPYTFSGASGIQQELQKGPVTVIFNVMKDFPAYKSGVYDPAWPPVSLGGHAVAIFGYGSEDGKAYWLVKNSWNDGWGEQGWFRIVRGTNACQMESGISASQMPVAADVSVAFLSSLLV